MGIATLVVPEADLDETSRKLVDKLANGPTKAYAAARTILKAWSAGGIAAADVMMLDVAIDLFKTEDTTKGILISAKAIQAGVQPCSPPVMFDDGTLQVAAYIAPPLRIGQDAGLPPCRASCKHAGCRRSDAFVGVLAIRPYSRTSPRTPPSAIATTIRSL
jgi:hypothetical protein